MIRRQLFQNAVAGVVTKLQFSERINFGTAAPISVRDFGAKGDGTANDGPGINRAIQYLRERQTRIGEDTFIPALVFPNGIYVTDESINLTALDAINTIVDGQGSVVVGKCSNVPVVDALGSRWLTIKDLNVVGDATLTPTTGLQIGVAFKDRPADGHKLFNVKILGHFRTACLLNSSSETSSFDHVFLWNNRMDPESYCLIQDGINHFNSRSSFLQTENLPTETDTSFNENYFVNCDFRHRGGGIPVWLADTSRHQFTRCYSATKGRASFYLFCGTNGHTMLDIDCHCETTGLRNVFLVSSTHAESVVIRGFSYKDHTAFASKAVLARSGPVKRITIEFGAFEIAGFFDPDCKFLDYPEGWSITGHYYSSVPSSWNAIDFAGNVFLGSKVTQLGMNRR